ncbi:MAG: oligosaccharide flippase family protein [Thiomicrorhabdus chilensis]|uniref:oligosaccharide flippase family protein n=1 Tax=Thiomicrorhabdus chilensis TaxID=63656 RepID=UPI00299DDC6C|nr:oligosaccharide flippase family protein [Thiomicrorhabdus chilensis]MDX1347443.1 oligosaccharide flippase family protein [Thiomicrorhabdus chilensis]
MTRNVVYKALSALWLSSVLGALFAFLLQVTLARNLNVEQYGTFASAFTITTLLIPLVGFGVAQFWLKSFGQQGREAFAIVKPSFYVILINVFVVGGFLFFWSLIGPHGELMQMALMFLFLYLCGQVSLEVLAARFQLEERYLHLSLWQTLPSFIRLIVVMMLVYFLGDALSLREVVFSVAAVGLVMIILSLVWLLPMLKGQVDLKGHTQSNGLENPRYNVSNEYSIQSVYQNAWPFGLSTLFYLIYFQSDIVLLQYLVGEKVAGFYNIAFIILAAVLLFPGVIYQRYLLPKMHRWAYHDPEKFYRVFRKGNGLMLVLGLFAMFITWWLAPYFIPYVFGEKFAPSLLILNVLAFSIPVLFVASSYGAILVTQEHIRTKVKLMGSVAVLNLILNGLLIPQYQAMGAAIATLISNSVLLIFYMLASKKVFRVTE